MKTFLLACAFCITLVASEAPASQVKIPNYIVDVKNFGLIQSKDAFFVIDSRKYGTINEHFGFAKKEDAQEYVKKNGGRVLEYEAYKKELESRK